jgi:putative MATE family efflux protein
VSRPEEGARRMTEAEIRTAQAEPDPALGAIPPVPAAPPDPPQPPASSPASSRRYDRSLVEGPLRPAVWKMAWPTMLQNVIGGSQGLVDHIMVGRYVGYAGNAAIGVSWQIFLVVIVFISSLFTGMNVLVARFVGAGNHEKVDQVVFNAFLLAIGLSIGIFAPLGYVLTPGLLDLVNAAPEVQEQALPFLRIMFGFSIGMLVFFMLGGALRSAGDARTPLLLGATVTGLNIVLNVILIRGLGPIPALGAVGAAIGTTVASGVVGLYAIFRLFHGGWVVAFPPRGRRELDWGIIRALFRFGLPTGIQGIAMNLGGLLLLAFIGSLAQSAAAQAAYSIGYTQLFSLITWTSVGLLGASAAMAGQNLGAGNPHRAEQAVHTAARFGLMGAVLIGLAFFFFPRQLLAVFGMDDPNVIEIGVQLLRVLSVSGLFITVALTYTGGLQGTGDTKSPLYISIVSQIAIPLGICFVIRQTSTLDPIDIWLAILAGHVTRCVLSVVRFNQGKWRAIKVDVGHH